MRLHLTWVGEAWHTAALGYRLSDRCRLWAFHVGTAVAARFRAPWPRSVTARLAPDGQPITITGGGELSVLHDVFVQGGYRAQGNPDVIFDLGANVGLVSIFYRRSYPRARIVAVEADLQTYRRLVQNVQGLDVMTLHRAAAGTDGRVAFFSNPSASLRSSMVRRSPDDVRQVVRSSTMQTLMDDAGVDHVDLLKLDIEGAEFDFLATAPLESIGEILGELHYDLSNKDEDFLRTLLRDFELDLRVIKAEPAGKRWMMFTRGRAYFRMQTAEPSGAD